MDKKEMKEYESPYTKRTQVELEDGVCTASANIQNPNTDSGRIDEHKTNTDFKGDFSDSPWDSNPVQ